MKQKFFLDRFSTNTEIPNFMKICLVGTQLFLADGRTEGQIDMTKVIATICNFANALNTS